MRIRVAVVTISDSCHNGTREDLSGPALCAQVRGSGWEVVQTAVLPDEASEIGGLLKSLCDSGTVDAIFTTGGTGVAARDVTPEVTRSILEKEIPGIGELIRAEGLKITPLAVLSRSLAGSRGSTLIVNLPGSPKGAKQSLDAIVRVVPHLVDLLHGRTGH